MNCKSRGWTYHYTTAIPRGSDLESRDTIILGTERIISTPKHLQCNARKMERDKGRGGGNPLHHKHQS